MSSIASMSSVCQSSPCASSSVGSSKPRRFLRVFDEESGCFVTSVVKNSSVHLEALLEHSNPFGSASASRVISEKIDMVSASKLLVDYKSALSKEDVRVLHALKSNAKPIVGGGGVSNLDVVCGIKLNGSISNFSQAVMAGRCVSDGVSLSSLSQDCLQAVIAKTHLTFGVEAVSSISSANTHTAAACDVFSLFGCSIPLLSRIISDEVFRSEVQAFVFNSDACEDLRIEFGLHSLEDSLFFINEALYNQSRDGRRKMTKAIKAIVISEEDSPLDFPALMAEISTASDDLVSHASAAGVVSFISKQISKSYVDNLAGCVVAFLTHRFFDSVCVVARSLLSSKFGRVCESQLSSGFLVAKKTSSETYDSISDSVIAELNREIVSKTGASFTRIFVCKPSSRYFSDDGTLEKASAREEGFKAQRKIFEANWSFCNSDDSFYGFVQKSRQIRCVDDNFRRVELFSELTQIKDPRTFFTTTKHAEILGSVFDFRLWQKCTGKTNEVDQLIMDPGQPVGFIRGEGDLEGFNRLNRFQGFAFPKTDLEFDPIEDAKIIQPYLNLLADNVGGDSLSNSEDCVSYALNWFASCLQKADVKLGVALIICNSMGSGKDVLLDTFLSLIGKSSFISTKPGEDLGISGRFNGALSGVTVVKCEELSIGDSAANVDAFKALITCPSLSIQKKGIDIYQEDSYLQLCATTNNSVSAVVSSEDRRICMLKGKPNIVRSSEEWKSLRGLFSTRAFLEAFARFLWSRDISAFSAKDDRPRTQIYENAKLACAPSYAKWMNQFVMQSPDEFTWLASEGGKFEAESRILKVSAAKLLNNYNTRSGSNKESDSGKKDFVWLSRIFQEYFGMPTELLSLAERKKTEAAICHYKSQGNRSFLQLDFAKIEAVLKSKGAWCDMN